jgi:hypothetical protein
MVSRLPTLVVLLNISDIEGETTAGVIEARISEQILGPKFLHVYSQPSQ